MPLQAPNLDDRRFADLVAEAKLRIPRYAPEWTDHNASDPGITMIQLFAWLGEMIMYRLNQVPELNYIKFLQLIGIERKPAVPAKAELTFSLPTGGAASVLIPQGTQVSAQVKQQPSAIAPAVPAPEDDQPVIFETDEPIYALGPALQNVQVFDGVNFVDYTEANNPTSKSYPAFGTRARDDSALMLGFNADGQFPTVEINLAVRVFIDPALVREVSCEAAASKAHPPATVQWEYWAGGSWEKLQVLKDETRALTATGHVYFLGPKDIKKAKLGKFVQPTDKEMYWIRCHLVQSQYELAPELEAVLINTVRATAVTTVKDESVGSSEGLPDQIFLLRNSPIYAKPPFPVDARLQQKRKQKQPPNEAEQEQLDKALRERELSKGFWLELDEGLGFKPWDEVEDFFNSGPDDRHYILNRVTGEIDFGNGERGAIPVAGANIVARYYRYGGGARGNVGTATAVDLVSTVVGVESVTNNYPAEGGADEEKISDTKARAPKELKARDRAVTPQDFEFIARQTPGVRVRRAHALPLYNPQFPGVEVPGAITVVIIPESADPKPLPSEGTMQTVCEYLNQRRLLTNEVFVAPPRYKQVKIEATVFAEPTANPAKVKTDIEKALTTYLHPLEGGVDGQGWPMGGDVLYSEVFRVALDVEGVQTIKDLRIVLDGERFGRCEDATIADDFMVFSDGHDITVTFTPSQT